MATKGKSFIDSIQERQIQPFVKSPVVDKSEGIGDKTTLDFIANVGDLGTKLYKDVKTDEALTGITQDIRKEIENYEIGSPSKIAEATNALDKSQIELSRTNTGDNDDAVAAIMQDINSQTEFLNKAKSQNRINGFEFDQRVKGILKDKVTQYPYLKPEIIAHAKTVLDLEGIDSRIKYDAKMASDKNTMQEYYLKQLLTDAKDIGIDTSSYGVVGSPDYDWGGLEQKIMKKRTIKQARQELKDNVEYSQDIDKAKIEGIKDLGIVEQFTIDQYEDDFKAITNFFTPKTNENGQVIPLSSSDIANGIFSAQQYVAKAKRDIRREFGTFMSLDGDIKNMVEFYEKQLDNTMKEITPLVDGKQISDILKNRAEAAKAVNDFDAEALIGNTERYINFLTRIKQNMLSLGFDENDPLFANIQKKLNKIGAQFEKTNPESYNTLIKNIEGFNKAPLDVIFDIQLPNLNAQTPDEFTNEMIEDVIFKLESNKGTNASKAAIYNKAIKSMAANNVSIDNLNAIDPEVKARYIQFIETQGVPLLKKSLQDRINAGDDIQLRYTANGKIVAFGKDVTADLQQNIIAPLNNSLLAYTKLMESENPNDYSGQLLNMTLEGAEQGANVNQNATVPTNQGPNMGQVINPNEQEPQVNPNVNIDTSQGTNLTTDSIPEGDRGTTTNETGPDMNQVNDVEDKFTIDFITEKLGPKESERGHRDKEGNLIKAYKADKSGEYALGQFQIKPSTAKNPGFGLPSIDLEESSITDQAQWAQMYLNALLLKYKGDKAKALAAYNYGAGNIDTMIEKHGDQWRTKVPKETREYINDLL
jgi:uncharacterized protein YuzE